MARANKPTVKTRNASVVAGIDKHITTNVTIGGIAFTPVELKAIFVAESTAIDAADALHKQWQERLQAVTQAGAKSRSAYHSLRSYLIGQYGADAKSVLNDFGMQPPKSGINRTVNSKAAAVQKGKATRVARHTMGTKQKKQVKGDVTGIVVTPVTTPKPAAPAGPAQGTTSSPAPSPGAQPTAAATAGPAPGATSTPAPAATPVR